MNVCDTIVAKKDAVAAEESLPPSPPTTFSTSPQLCFHGAHAPTQGSNGLVPWTLQTVMTAAA